MDRRYYNLKTPMSAEYVRRYPRLAEQGAHWHWESLTPNGSGAWVALAVPRQAEGTQTWACVCDQPYTHELNPRGGIGQPYNRHREW